MKTNEKIKALEAISRMLAGWLSSQSQITESTGEAYLMAVEDNSLSAIEAACAAFLKGQVSGANPDFPPSAARLASMVEALDEAAYQLSGEAPKLVAYPIGGQPPPGYVALGATEDRKRRRQQIAGPA